MDIKESLKKVGIIPKYTEPSMFIAALTFLLIFATEKSLRTAIITNTTPRFDILFFALVYFIIGLVLSLYYALKDTKASKNARFFMLFFMVMTNIIVGAYAGYIVLTNTTGILAIFPAYNMINAIILFSLFRTKWVDETCISDKNATRKELIAGSIGLIIVFAISAHILKSHWAITYSICLAYSSFIEGIRKVLQDGMNKR